MGCDDEGFVTCGQKKVNFSAHLLLFFCSCCCCSCCCCCLLLLLLLLALALLKCKFAMSGRLCKRRVCPLEALCMCTHALTAVPFSLAIRPNSLLIRE